MPRLLVLTLLALLAGAAPAWATPPASTTPPAISGSAREGQTLSRDTGTWSATTPLTFTQRWQRCDPIGAECVNLPATGATYTLIAADVGSAMRVVVTATNADGVAVATSDPTAAVTGTPPSNTAAPTVAGNLRDGQTLTAGKGSWSGTLPMTYAYEWRRCDTVGSACAPIDGATAATYLLTPADVGSTIRLRVTAGNAAGSSSATSAASVVVGPPAPPVNTVAPAISGTPRDASTLSSTTGTWTGAATITFTRRWQRCDALGVACLDTTATTPTYAVGTGDIGSTIRLVVTAANPDGTATATSVITSVVTPNPPSSTAAPSVSGNPRDGQTLAATTGTWSGTAPLTFAREWRRCDAAGTSCAAIAGETAATYALTPTDVGHTIRFAITATNDAGTGTAVANPTAVIGPPAPPVDSVLPVITGTTTDGQTLSSSTGTWTGAATITYTRRWQRCDALGAGCLDTGVTSVTYKLSPADVGATLRLAVTATNPDGTATATSLATGVVAPLGPANTAPPGITGSAKDLQTLTTTTGTWNGTTPIAYATQWQRCDSAGAHCVAIAGATASTYAVTGTDVGLTLRAAVTATNAAGSTTATSGPTAIVTAAPPVNTVLPAVSGTARDGLTLTASTGTWTGSSPVAFSYQWRRCSSAGSSCVDVTGATGASYAMSPADVGSTLRVKVVATNGAGTANATSPLTLPVAPAPPVATTAPALSGTAVDGSTLSASAGTWTGTPVLAMSYRWERCDPLLACTAIAGATAGSYVLTSADVGVAIRVVVTAVNAGGTVAAASDPTPAIAPLAPSATVAPAITGTPRDGQTLTAAPGTWRGTTPVAYAYQWRRCDSAGATCSDLAGATAPTYALGPGDAGTTLRVAVTATNAGGTATAASAFTPVVAPKAPINAVAPTITGLARDGRTLTADPGDWTGTPPLELAYQWRRCDGAGATCADVDGAVGPTYVLATADVGATLRVVVKATNGGGTASATTAPTGVVQPNPPVNLTAPTITGSVVDGELLTAVDGTWTGVVTIGFDHRWWRCDSAGANCGIVPDATDSTYRVSGADVGLTLRVEVIGRNAGGSTSAFSDASPVGQPAAPVSTAPPVISGRHGVGELLEATRGSWVGSPTLTYAYQWERCTDAGCAPLPGEDSDAYRLTAGDLGATVRVSVTATNAAGSATAVSDRTPAVRDDPPVVLTLPAVTGDLVAETVPLTADDGTWSGTGPMTASYRWRRCDAYGGACVDVDGGAAKTYTPVAADIGSTLRVIVSMDNGVGLASATSAPSAIVAPAPPRVTVPPVVTAAGTLPGKSLTGTTGTWAGAVPIAYALQWLRCDLDGEGCVAIADATAAKYTLTSADIGHLLRLRVTASNATAPVVARSAPVGPVGALPPATTGKPKVTVDGKPHAGSIVHAEAGTWTGSDPLAFTYRWQRCASATDCRDVPGATGASYTATPDDVGQKLRVVVTATNAAGAVSVESAVTDAVAGQAPAGAAKPSVAGTLHDGATLTATPGGWAGTAPFTYTYAWERCTNGTCKPIKGAEAATYTLGPDDVGQQIAVKVTAANAAGKASAESAPTAAVAAVRPRNRARPTVSRLPTVLEPGLQLRGRPGRWTGSAPLVYTYQWVACDRYGAHCRMVKGATAATYALRKGDLRGTRLRRSLRLAVTATNAAGERTALSAPVGAAHRQAPVRVTVRGASLAGHLLTIRLRCKAGAAPCAGRVTVARHRASVSVRAGRVAAVTVQLRPAEARALPRRVRVHFASARRASGRSISARTRLTRLT